MMEKEICVITGCNSGIGKVTALQMARQGYEVIMLVRESEKSVAAFEDIIRESKSHTVRLEYVDLSSISSIMDVLKRLKKEYSKIDLLINNAGVFKRNEEITEDGFEWTLMVNYLAPFILTRGLMPLIQRTPHAKIINIGSQLSKKGELLTKANFGMASFNGMQAYANSKLLLLYLTVNLSKRLSDTSVTVNCVHPGFVNTGVFRDYPKWMGSILGWFIDTPEEGAESILFLVNNSSVREVTGKYFKKTKMSPSLTEFILPNELKEVHQVTTKLVDPIIERL